MSEQSTNQPEIWVDLTDIAAWQGHFSGIQRVVYSYAKRYQAEGAKFFIYRRLSGNFRQVRFEDYFTEVNKSSGSSGRPSLKVQLKQTYRAVFPAVVRKRATPVIRKILHYVFKSLALIYYVVPKKDPFTVGDKVLILGAGWESPMMIKRLASIRSAKKIKLIHFWHDMLPISQPHLFDKKLVVRQNAYSLKALEISDGTVCASKATLADAQDIAKKIGVDISNHLVLREGEDSYHKLVPRRPSELPQNLEKFIFSLGTLEVRKNHQLLYQAYKLAQQKKQEMPALVIVGRKGWLAHDFLSVLKKDPSIVGKIFYLKSLPDNEVLWLVENSMFTIYPSLYEGWGLTIADSLGRGKLCLTANLSSMPEVGGDLADYFSPYDTGECLAKIREYYTSPDKLAEKEKALKKYRPYSWDESFTTLNNYVKTV